MRFLLVALLLACTPALAQTQGASSSPVSQPVSYFGTNYEPPCVPSTTAGTITLALGVTCANPVVLANGGSPDNWQFTLSGNGTLATTGPYIPGQTFTIDVTEGWSTPFTLNVPLGWTVSGLCTGSGTPVASCITTNQLPLSGAPGGKNTLVCEIIDTTPTIWCPSVSAGITTTLAPGFFVATNGSDSNAGTISAPFATLGKCQTTMQGSGTKTCYVRAGTYTTSSSAGSCAVTGGGTDALILGSSDTGETWSYYPPDGYNSATITSGGVLTTGWCINSGANVTINGLKFAGFTINDIISRGVINVQNNEFTGTTDTNCCDRAAILVGLGVGSTFSHNYIHDVSGTGIDFNSGDSGATYPSWSNVTVNNNFFLNTCSGIQDCGAIYCFDHGTTYSSNIAFTNNYIRDVFKTGGGGVTLSGMGIYFDEGCSNVTAKGNVITGFLSDCFFNHGGAGNIVQGNICDEEFTGSPSPQTGFMGYQWIATPGGGTGAGNVASGNIITAKTSTTNTGVFVECRVSTWTNPLQVNPATPPTASDFFNFGTGTVSHGTFNCGSAGVDVTDSGDTNPQAVTPGMSCADSYPTTSGLFSSPVAFPAKPTGWDAPGFWGPPGFVDPLTGNAPSWNSTFSCR